MTSTPSQNREPGAVEIDQLLSWLEQQPELAPLRAKANGLLCRYQPGEQNPAQRIIFNDTPELTPEAKGFFWKLRDQIWVPARSLRGNAFATPELDGSLNTTAKIMSFSTLWDFITTIPLFQAVVGGGPAALPGATLISLLLLLVSNAAGAKSTDQRRGHVSTAMVSLLAFALLSAAKTAFSGVGVDLLVGSQRIASTYAAELAAAKMTKDKAELNRLEGAGADYQLAAQRCSELQNQMKALDRNSNEKQYISLFVQAFGQNATKVADQGLNPGQLINKYGSVGAIPGVCRQRDTLQALNLEKARPLATTIEQKSLAIAQVPPLDYLQTYEPALYKDNFRVSNGGQFEWVNGMDAASQATKQFYANLTTGNFSQISYSLAALTFSVILTAAATILLYLTGRNRDVKASFTGELEEFRNDRLDLYEQALQRKLDSGFQAQQMSAEETSDPAPLRESEVMDARSLRWIRMNGRSAGDKAVAKSRYQQILFDLWRKHIAATGETYYPLLRNDLSDHAQFLADPDHG